MTRVEASITVAAGIEEVFRAWTEASALSRWFKPSPAAHCRVLVHEPRPGGRWGVEVTLPSGERYRVGGRYLDLVRPTGLRFTWTWEEGGPEGFHDETLVHVDLARAGAGTRIRVLHERLPPALLDVHRRGWEGALRNLGDPRSPTS